MSLRFAALAIGLTLCAPAAAAGPAFVRGFLQAFGDSSTVVLPAGR